MKKLYFLDWPDYKYKSDSHPLYRWKKKLKDHGIDVRFCYDHTKKELKNIDYLFIHSRYFDKGWQNIAFRSSQNEASLMNYLTEMKRYVGKLIWFDTADSTGSSDFPIIHLVDAFVKKQLHKDLNIYCKPEKLRTWIETSASDKENTFDPCHPLQLYKIKLGWNIGLKDYRYFGYKMNRLSNYLSYSIYPNKYHPVDIDRTFDLTFRGSIPKSNGSEIARQRTFVMELINSIERNKLTGLPVSKKRYLKELRQSKICISPFGWGEICYRDFESFISGSLLIKPRMDHLITYPNVYKENETYLPVSWKLNDLQPLVEYSLDHYKDIKKIAQNGQELYRKTVADGEAFVTLIKNILN
ncbi:glycosyltransferase family 1 protein [Desertivirga arenae]|uniref:glycosyltransferase family 1 protein n=1 Tax=Desertivirga arenae TaxID=2810309 RepID=UPI001A97C7A9|nr:glycosyltransferase family 1 protein [Pedobacter sp. SYSU D00823]